MVITLFFELIVFKAVLNDMNDLYIEKWKGKHFNSGLLEDSWAYVVCYDWYCVRLFYSFALTAVTSRLLRLQINLDCRIVE